MCRKGRPRRNRVWSGFCSSSAVVGAVEEEHRTRKGTTSCSLNPTSLHPQLKTDWGRGEPGPWFALWSGRSPCLSRPHHSPAVTRGEGIDRPQRCFQFSHSRSRTMTSMPLSKGKARNQLSTEHGNKKFISQSWPQSILVIPHFSRG